MYVLVNSAGSLAVIIHARLALDNALSADHLIDLGKTRARMLSCAKDASDVVARDDD